MQHCLHAPSRNPLEARGLYLGWITAALCCRFQAVTWQELCWKLMKGAR